MHAETALHEYVRRAQQLSTFLTHSIQLTEPSEEFKISVKKDERYLENALKDSTQDFAKEPYRRKLKIIRYRLKQKLNDISKFKANVKVDTEDAYNSSNELLNDLYLIRDSLISDQDQILLDYGLNDFIRLVETFGLHLVSLDIREESTKHSATICEVFKILKKEDYSKMTEDEKIQNLGEIIKSSVTYDDLNSQLSNDSKDVISVFSIMKILRKKVSSEALGNYVISMTRLSLIHISEPTD